MTNTTRQPSALGLFFRFATCFLALALGFGSFSLGFALALQSFGFDLE